MVGPPAASAPRCAAASMPYAPPETTVHPRSARSVASSLATFDPYCVAAREPTTATERTAASRRSAPTTYRAEGSCRAKCRQLRRPLAITGDDESATDLVEPALRLIGVDHQAGAVMLPPPSASHRHRVDALEDRDGPLLADCCAKAFVAGLGELRQPHPGPRRSAHAAHGRPPPRRDTAEATSAARGWSTPARSASVQATRNTRSTPRPVSRPRPTSSSTIVIASWCTRCVASNEGPGTSALVDHGSSCETRPEPFAGREHSLSHRRHSARLHDRRPARHA